MARIDMSKVGTAALVGVADIVATQANVRLLNQSPQDLVTLASSLGGAAGVALNWWPAQAEAIMLGGIPRLTIYVWNMIQTIMAGGGGAARRYPIGAGAQSIPSRRIGHVAPEQLVQVYRV